MCSPARSFCREFLSCHWILTYLTFNLYWVPLALFSSLLLLTLWSYFFGSLRLKLLPVWKPESSLLRHYGPYRLGCLISQCNYSLYLLLMFFPLTGPFSHFWAQRFHRCLREQKPTAQVTKGIRRRCLLSHRRSAEFSVPISEETRKPDVLPSPSDTSDSELYPSQSYASSP